MLQVSQYNSSLSSVSHSPSRIETLATVLEGFAENSITKNTDYIRLNQIRLGKVRLSSIKLDSQAMLIQARLDYIGLYEVD